MPRFLTLSLLIFILLAACSPSPTATPTNLPTVVPSATPMPTLTSTVAPTLELWMQSLPESVISVEMDGNIIFGLDAQGERIMEYDIESGGWVEVESSYKIVREAGRESEMSTVEWVQREDGSWRLPEELLEWERENVLPTQVTDEQAAEIDYMEHWGGSNKNLAIGVNSRGTEKLTEVVQLLGVYKSSLEPWGMSEQRYIVTYQYTNADNSQAHVHFLLTEEKYSELKKDIFGEKLVFIPSGVIGSSSKSRIYPDERYDGLVSDFYQVQFAGLGSRTEVKNHMMGLVAQANRSESLTGEPEEIIWSPDVIEIWW